MGLRDALGRIFGVGLEERVCVECDDSRGLGDSAGVDMAWLVGGQQQQQL